MYAGGMRLNGGGGGGGGRSDDGYVTVSGLNALVIFRERYERFRLWGLLILHLRGTEIGTTAINLDLIGCSGILQMVRA